MTRFSLRDKRLFEIIEGEITRVDCSILALQYTVTNLVGLAAHQNLLVFLLLLTLWHLDIAEKIVQTHMQLLVFLRDITQHLLLYCCFTSMVNI